MIEAIRKYLAELKESYRYTFHPTETEAGEWRVKIKSDREAAESEMTEEWCDRQW